MFAIQLEYLLGRAVATDPHNRDEVEWPPHPGRFFSAFVDAHGTDPTEESEAALRWLETLPPPSIKADLDGDVSFRDAVKFWVPANDEVQPKRHLRSPLADRRERKERFFPAAIPADPTVTFVWDADCASHRVALQRLAERLIYLGHSSSLVSARVLPEVPEANLLPDSDGDLTLRVPAPGRFDRLSGIHHERARNSLIQPPYGRDQPYSRRKSIAQGPHGSALVVVIESGPLVSLEQTALIIPTLRAALFEILSSEIPSILSGHEPDGRPLGAPHLALCPLANVGFDYSDGSVKAFAAVLPRGIDKRTRARFQDALTQLTELRLGRLGVLRVRFEESPVLKSARFDRYAKRATHWASVTPVALSRHAKPRKGVFVEDIVAWELSNLGLPVPKKIACSWVPLVHGAPAACARDDSAKSKADAFSRGDLKQLVSRHLCHVAIEFHEAVRGPLLVGAGRHVGFGLLLPHGARGHAD